MATKKSENNESYEALKRTLERERKARKLAEKLLEDKARDLYLSNKELKDSLDNVKQAQSQLVQSEKMASVGILAAGVAHEINNPIAYIYSNLESLFDYAKDIRNIIRQYEEWLEGTNSRDIKEKLVVYKNSMSAEYIQNEFKEIIEASLEGAAKVQKIVADLSEFSALNTPDFSWVDINEVLEKTISLAWNQLKYDVELKRDYAELPKVSARAGKLGQVFLNLILNALHTMQECADRENVLTIKTYNGRSSVTVWVSDTGKGISPEHLNSIYDPFFTTKAVGKGTGLGLHISQNIISNHKGTLTVVDSSPEGTTFEVRLPVDQKKSNS